MLTKEQENKLVQALKENRLPAYVERHLKLYYIALDRGFPESYLNALDALMNDLKMIED